MPKERKIHPGEAAGIIAKPIPHHNKRTRRYRKGDVDLDSIIAYISHIRENNDLPDHILRVRGRLRTAFPGMCTTKRSIKAAYEKAGWDIKELDLSSKAEMKAEKRMRMISDGKD